MSMAVIYGILLFAPWVFYAAGYLDGLREKEREREELSDPTE